MTVKELIKDLQRYDPATCVKVEIQDNGIRDATFVESRLWDVAKKDDQVTYTHAVYIIGE